MAHLTPGIVSALSWALVHSIWQGLLVYMLLRAVLAAIPGKYASARYITAVSALAALTGAFIATFVYLYNTGLPTVHYAMAAVTTDGQHTTAATTIPLTYDGSFTQTLSAWFNSHTQLIVNIYLAGMLLLLFRIVYNLFTLKNLKYKGTTLPDANWQQMLAKCQNILGINNKVQLFFSARLTVPLVMGTIKPVILVPVALANQLSTREAEAILLHELAHIRRNDYLVNMIQLFIETILFYNPFVWLISSIIRKEREYCCDDMVVNATTERLPYAKALAALETFRQQPLLPSLAATGSNNQLLNRIKRIMEMNNHNVNYGQLAAVLLTVLLLAGSITFFSPGVQAQSKKDKKKETTEKTEKAATVKKQVIIESEMDIDEDGKDDKKHLQKNVLIVKNGDTLKNYSINKSLSETDAALDEVFSMLEELKMDGIVDEAMAGFDWNSLGDSVNVDININGKEISAEVRKALAESHKAMGEVRKALAESRKAMGEAHKEVAIARKEYSEAMADARKEMSEVSREQAEARVKVIKSLKEHEGDYDDDVIYIRRTGEKVPTNGKIFVTSSHDKLLKSLEKDGLIDRKNGFKLVKKGDELYIDGIKQSKEVYKKYEPMIDVKNLTIKGNYRKISIDTRE
jgi:bla regulator protein BlaR1